MRIYDNFFVLRTCWDMYICEQIEAHLCNYFKHTEHLSNASLSFYIFIIHYQQFFFSEVKIYFMHTELYFI